MLVGCLTGKASACNFTKINTPPWVFFTFFKLYKQYQIAQRITYYKVPKYATETLTCPQDATSTFSHLDLHK